MSRNGTPYVALLIVLAWVLCACGGASAATGAPPTAPVPTLPPTATPRPTPDISVYADMDLVGGDPQLGLNIAIAYQCQLCHYGTHEEKGPRFAAVDGLLPILQRGELRIADPAYEGQAAANLDYVLESIFIPEAYLAPGKWAVTKPDDFSERIEKEELVHLLAWMETFSAVDDEPG